MKAIEILKKYEHNKWVYIDNKDIKEAIKELEDLQQSNKDLLNTVIEAQKVIKNVLEGRK